MTISRTVTNMLNVRKIVIVLVLVNFNPSNGQDCPRPPNLLNGRTKIKQRGHFVMFKCFRPYILVGSSKALCINRYSCTVLIEIFHILKTENLWVSDKGWNVTNIPNYRVFHNEMRVTKGLYHHQTLEIKHPYLYWMWTYIKM